MIKYCANCSEKIPATVRIDGKIKNLCSRKYCLVCSPFGVHNTRKIHVNSKPVPHSRNVANLSEEELKEFKSKQKVYYQSKWQERKAKRREQRLDLLKRLGAKCIECGYCKNMAALHFHHKNSKEKLFTIDIRNLQGKSEAEINDEINKCEILCSNCHMEKHHPDLDFN